jgi:carlactone C-19 oxidase
MLVPPAVRFSIIVFLVYVALPLYLGHAVGGLHGVLTVVAGLLTALYLYVESPRRVTRGIPGPPALPLIGNLPEFVKLGYHIYYGQMAKQYGDVVAIQMGAHPQVVISDPTLIREVCLEKFESFMNRKNGFMMRKSKGLLTAHGKQWQSSRRALNPAFNSLKLSAFADTISNHCDKMTKRLGRIVETTKGDDPIDVLRLFGDLTMDVIGSTSFDSEFGLQEEDPPTLHDNKETAKAESKLDLKDLKTTDPETESETSSEHNDADLDTKKQKRALLEAAKFIFASLKGPLGTGGMTEVITFVLFPFLEQLYKLAYPILQTPEAKLFWKHLGNLDTIMKEVVEGRGSFVRDSIVSTTSSLSKRASDASESSNGSPVDSFIDLLRKARDPESGIRLDDEEVRDQLNLFVLAGYETTASTLAFTAFLLSQNPHVEAKLVEEINRLAPDKEKRLTFRDLAEFTYTSNVVNEALRLYPPGAMLSREANRDVCIGGSHTELDDSDGKQYQLRKGTWVVIPVYSIHRDERFWENPEVFDPDRFLPERSEGRPKYAHLPFGLGPRNCIGQRFALEEAKLAVIALYREYTFKLHSHTEVPLKLKAGITLSPANGIWMTVHPQK